VARYRSRTPRKPKPQARKPVQRDANKDARRAANRRETLDPLVSPLSGPASTLALLSRSAALDRPAKEKLLLSLQGQYGNDYVGQVLSRARAEEDELAPIPDQQIHGQTEEEEKEHTATTPQVVNKSDEKDLQVQTTPEQSIVSRGPGSAMQQSSGGFIRLVPRAQRFNEKGQPVGPIVDITDSSQNVDMGEVTNGDRGFIQFFFDANWDFHGQGLVPENGTAKLVTTTPFRVPAKTGPDDDKLKFGKTRPSLLASQGTGAAMDKQPTTSEDADDLGGSVTVTPSVTYQLQTAVQTQVQGTVQILFFSLSESIAVQSAVNEVDSISRAYTANLRYKPAKPIPPPVTKQVKRFAMTAEFGVNQREPRQGELGLLEMWWNGQAGLTPLPNDEARAAVRSGQTEVAVIGHASHTGSRAYNLVLAKDRADNVANFLRADRLMGSAAHVSSSSAGFDAATAPGEEQTERFVEVVFEAQVDDTAPATDTDKTVNTTTAD
jgi:OmpA family protein